MRFTSEIWVHTHFLFQLINIILDIFAAQPIYFHIWSSCDLLLLMITSHILVLILVTDAFILIIASNLSSLEGDNLLLLLLLLLLHGGLLVLMLLLLDICSCAYWHVLLLVLDLWVLSLTDAFTILILIWLSLVLLSLLWSCWICFFVIIGLLRWSSCIDTQLLINLLS